MSHFTVLVIGPDFKTQLAPYQENNMDDCPQEFLEFREDEDADVDEKMGKKGYWENPNRKWDWYSVGGRWAGFFKLKAGSRAPKPKPHYGVAMGIADAPKENTADEVLKGDVDFEQMRGDAAHDAALEWDFVGTIFHGLPEHTSWELFDKEDIEKAREAYHLQPRIVAWKNKSQSVPREQQRTWPVDLTFGNPDRYSVSRENYIRSARDGAVTTFAVVKDGKWYERGQMGWFGTVIGEKDVETWNSMFTKLIDELPDDTPLTLIDCHI